MPVNPRHARRRFSLRRARTVEPAAAPMDPRWGPTWLPEPLPSELGDQARRELAQLAARRQDPWAGTRDTDRSL